MKAEYMATSHYIKEAVLVRQCLADVEYVQQITNIHHKWQSLKKKKKPKDLVEIVFKKGYDSERVNQTTCKK